MRVIDAHVHLDESGGSIAVAVDQLDRDLEATGIEAAIVLHLEMQPWSAAEVAGALEDRPRLVGFVHVDPRAEDAGDRLHHAIDDLGYRGLKLHPRLLGHGVDDPETVRLVGLAGARGVPVLIDAFPDGTWLLDGFDPRAFGRLARACPDTRIVAAHAGGHHCIDMMMIAKRVPNLWLDLSFSLLYYRGSSVVDDLVYACRSMRFERIMYGSDHPDRGVAETLAASLDELGRRGVEGDDLDRLLYANAAELLWPT